MLDHNWLIDPIRLIIQKYKTEWFALTVVAYDEVYETKISMDGGEPGDQRLAEPV